MAHHHNERTFTSNNERIQTYDTINKRKFYSRAVNPVTFGSETLSHLAPKIWELVPVEIKGLVW